MTVEARLSQADQIISKFGGVRATARALGHRNASTVQGWRRCGYVPHRHEQDLLAAAREHSIDLVAEDFVVHLQEAAPSDGSSGEAV